MDFTPKSLPTNIEAEQAVLAAVLVNNKTMESVTDFLKPEHFTLPAHQELFKLAFKQFSAGQTFDVITVKNYLEQQGTLESVGGIEYLKELASAGSTVATVSHYAHIIFDNARRRELISMAQSVMDNAYTEDLDTTVDKQIELAEQKLFNLASTGNTENQTVSLAVALKGALQEAEMAYKADGKISGLTTGLDDLDKSISGLHKSDLLIIAGRPGMGKTTLAMNIAFNAANAIFHKRANNQFTGGVVFFSLEMSKTQLAARVLSSQTNIPSKTIRDGTFNDEEATRMASYADELSKIPLYIDDTASMSVPMIKARARRLARKQGGISLIVIDYLQLITQPGARPGDNRVQELSDITRGLKILAKELDVPVIALSQLSRTVESREDKRPLLSDLRDSGSIEQDADIVMFTYREEYYIKQPSENAKEQVKEKFNKSYANAHGKADLIIAKNRHGRTETIRLSFTGEYFLFDNLNEHPLQQNINNNSYTNNTESEPTPAPDLSNIADDIL